MNIEYLHSEEEKMLKGMFSCCTSLCVYLAHYVSMGVEKSLKKQKQ